MTVWWLECCLFCFFKQKTAYEMRISDWSSHVCSSDLAVLADGPQDPASRFLGGLRWPQPNQKAKRNQRLHLKCGLRPWLTRPFLQKRRLRRREGQTIRVARPAPIRRGDRLRPPPSASPRRPLSGARPPPSRCHPWRYEEHKSEPQSL